MPPLAATAGTPAALQDLFRDPPRRFSPVPIWWWSGEALDSDRLCWQLERLAAGGVYNAVILNLAPTGPLYGADPDEPPFQSEAWWNILARVCQRASDLGISLWFYDQIGFSGANLQADIVRAAPTFAGQWLARLVQDVGNGLELRCPTGGQPLGASALPLAGDGRPAGPPIPLRLEGSTVRWDGKGPHRVMLFYVVTRGFDYFQPAACRALVDHVHEEFARRLGEHVGTTVVGSFQDELPSLPTWGRAFADEFQRRRGYDIREYLVHLWEDLGPESARVRSDYHRVRAELAEDAFFRPLFDWHERHGLICGFDQQGPARAGRPVEATQFYADYLRTHRWFGAPGSDHHGEAKIHSSLAHLYGRPRVWIEAFHSSGWGGTLDETFDWLIPWLRAGATLYNPHAVYYSTRGGWWEWAPPSTCWRQPYWRHYPQFATAVSRLCAILSQGTHLCEVAILYPTATVQAGLTLDGPTLEAQAAQATYLALVGRMYWQAMAPGVLDRDRRDFDVLDDASLQRAEVEGAALRIGAEQYRAILLPACTTLETASARILQRFVEAGGLLIAVGAVPERAAGTHGDTASVTALGAFVAQGRARLVMTPDEVPAALGGLRRRVEAPVPTLLRQVGDATVLFVPAAFPCATRHRTDEDWRQVDYDFDPARYAKELVVTVAGITGEPELWELTTGRRRRLPARQVGNAVAVTVPFDDAPVALLVWGAGGGGDEVDVVHHGTGTPARVTELTGPWKMELIPTLDNRWGDVAWPPAAGAPPVQCWTLQYRREQPAEDGLAAGWTHPGADVATWERVHATFGIQGWWYGPADPAALPTPHPGRIAADGRNSLDIAGWQPAVYSLSRGIDRDPLHRGTLGPKGHVPEEFLDFGQVPVGQAVQYRTAFHLPAAMPLTLAVGAPAAKEAWLNGEHLGDGGPGYLWLQPVRVREGWNVLEFRLIAEETSVLRASVALVRDAEAFRRPEWLRPDDAPVAASVVRFQRTFSLPWRPRAGRLQLAADAPARLLVNNQEIGRQGGFDPYDHRRVGRVQPYDLTAALRAGQNSILVELQDLGQPCAVLIDGLVVGDDEERISLISDERWEATRDGRPIPLALRRRQWQDPAWSQLWRRPHPLSGSTWLERRADQGVVLPLQPDPCPGERRIEWLRFPLPPGAERLTLPLAGQVEVFVDGQPMPVENGEVRLPGQVQAHRTCVVRVVGATGGLGGALLQGPITFGVGTGRLELGDWEAQGLSAYAGGITYHREVEMEHRPGERVWLDLGRVRGTAEVRVNGVTIGYRIWSPYRFAITDQIRAGLNAVEIQVFNTLAPYLAAVSPTHYVFPGQAVSGLFGPVRLEYYNT